MISFWICFITSPDLDLHTIPSSTIYIWSYLRISITGHYSLSPSQSICHRYFDYLFRIRLHRYHPDLHRTWISFGSVPSHLLCHRDLPHPSLIYIGLISILPSRAIILTIGSTIIITIGIRIIKITFYRTIAFRTVKEEMPVFCTFSISRE